MKFGYVKMWAASLVIGIAALAAIAPSRAQFAKLPEGPNRELVETVCGSCHDIEMVAIGRRSEERWSLTIGRSQDELPTLLERLGEIDLFVHDSEHSYECMDFEFRAAWT